MEPGESARESPAPRSSLLESTGALGLCLACAFLLRVPAFGMPLDRDAAVYAVIGRSLRSSLPYRDLIDHKQPVVYPVYWLLDAIAPRSDVVVHVLSAVVGGIAAWVLFMGLRSRIGRARASVAAALALVLGASRYVEGFDLNTEHLLVLVGTLLVVVALALEGSSAAWAPVLVGVLCGVAILTKAVGVLLAPAALLPLLLGRASQERPAAKVLLLFAAGTLAPVLLVIGLYATQGALADFVSWNWVYNRQYASVLTLADRIERLRTYPADLLLIGVSGLASVVWLRTRGVRDTLALTLVAWLAGAALGALLGGYSYAHYFAPVAVPAAALLVAPLPASWSLRAKVAALTVGVITIGPFVFDLGRGLDKGPHALSSSAYGRQARIWWAYKPAGRLLRARARPGDRLYVAGNEAGFYWQSDVAPASRLLYDSPLLIRPELQREIERALCSRPPRFVVLPLGTLPAYASCLNRMGYRTIATQRPSILILERG
jgi:4-amino-4-deoxy-L-arabinose transferase-like glycosyltransferase